MSQELLNPFEPRVYRTDKENEFLVDLLSHSEDWF